MRVRPALMLATTALVACADPPVIDFRVQDHQIGIGTSLILRARVSSSASPFQFQWEKDGRLIPGQVFETLGISDARAADTGTYVPLATNESGTTRGPAVHVGVVSNPIAPFKIVQPGITGTDVRFLDYLDGTFLMGNSTGELFWSADGEHWTESRKPYFAFGTRGPQVSAVVPFGGRYYAFQGSSFPGGWVSDDLRAWEYLPWLAAATAVATGGGRILIKHRVPDSNETVLQISSDLMNWERGIHGRWDFAETLNYIAGRWVATGFGEVFTSSDGILWTEVPDVPSSFAHPRSQDRLPVFDGALTSVIEDTLFRSVDGVSWTASPISGEDGNRRPLPRVHRLFAAHGRLWAQGEAYLYSSTDLFTWVGTQTIESVLPFSPHSITAAAGASNTFVVGSADGIVALSRDPAVSPVLLSDVRFGDLHALPDFLIGEGFPSRFHRSRDGRHWTVLNEFQQSRKIVYHEGVYVFAESSLDFSYDALNWQRPRGVVSGLISEEMLAAGNGRFVGGSNSEFFMWSDDGTSWNFTDEPSSDFSRIRFVDGQFIAIGVHTGNTGVFFILVFQTTE